MNKNTTYHDMTEKTDNINEQESELSIEMEKRRSLAYEILDVPQFTQQDVLSVTEPRLDSGTLQNWVNRDILALQHQLETTGRRRLYRGKDVITVCVVQKLREIGVPIKFANLISKSISGRAFELIIKNGELVDKSFWIAVYPMKDDWGITNLQENKEKEIKDNGPEACVIIQVDKLINRVLSELSKYIEDAANTDTKQQDNDGLSSKEEPNLDAQRHLTDAIMKVDKILNTIKSEKRNATLEEENKLGVLNIQIERIKAFLRIK